VSMTLLTRATSSRWAQLGGTGFDDILRHDISLRVCDRTVLVLSRVVWSAAPHKCQL
jgi:hypothetical protein